MKNLIAFLFMILSTVSSFGQSQKLKITTGKTVLYAEFTDSQTSKDFIKMLPLTLNMNDLSGREKYSGISRELSKNGSIKTSFQKGDLAYWLGGGIAVFYNQDDHEIKAGLIVLARIEKGIEVFKEPESMQVKFEVAKN
ncbi:cyclophilin-like fold protein [uncultured Flavobacterium sp.]|uniref:cyclophilin-like fold protein n=1 Tax=uncultured Flavobacterium sp. TaxID=165435 RepID=UPI0030815D18